MQPTVVTFPGGSQRESATILATVVAPGSPELIIITDVTPFHPIDPWWPDQPSDHGHIIVNGLSLPVREAQVVGKNVQSGEFLLGTISGIKRGDPAWTWCVGHVVDQGLMAATDGTACELVVNADYRHAISAGHTGCHIAALALNDALDEFWRKEVVRDTRGRRNFDQIAIQSSKISDYQSKDVYRIGKSLRKAGFDVDRLWLGLAEVEKSANSVCRTILTGVESIRVTPEASEFTFRRKWQLRCEGMSLEIDCGGVHLDSANDVDSIQLQLHATPEEGELTMYTRVFARSCT